MSYYVKVCDKCKAINHPSMTYCAKCGADLPSIKQESDTKPIQPPAYAVMDQVHDSFDAGNGKAAQSGPIECRVIDINMPFWSMVNLMVKVAIAAIPAMIVLIIFSVFALSILAAIGFSLK